MTKNRFLFFDTCYYSKRFHGRVGELSLKSPYLILGHAVVFMEWLQGVRSA